MTARFLLASLVIACASPSARVAPTAKSAPVDEARGTAAYDAKNWRECARIYEALAAQNTKPPPSDAFYAAASCDALGGMPDAAFAALDRSIAAGFHDVDLATRDPDLASLHVDPRWSRIMTAIRDRFAAYERSLGEPALRRELLVRAERDQVAIKDPEHASWKAVNHDNNVWVKEVIAKHGWPSKRLVGEDGAHAAWLLVQHIDAGTGDGNDPEAVAYQSQCLAKMEPLVKTGDVSGEDYALLYDRVAVGEHRPQRYGTQFLDGKPRPIEDEAHVDERRRAMGMSTMAAYTAKMMKLVRAQPTPVETRAR